MAKIRFGLGGALVAAGLAVFGAVSAGRAGTDWYVTPVGSDTVNDGTNGWSDAFLTISHALAQAADGDTILLTNGVFSIGAELIVNKGVTIAGIAGWAETTVERNPAAANFRVFTVAHADAVLSGLTIRNGNRSTTTGLSGCGVYLNGGMVTNCYITANWGGNRDSKSRGAGIYVNQGLLVDSIVHGNGSTGAIGGGVYIANGLADRCTISGNSAGDQYGPDGNKKGGAGVYMTGGTLRNSLVRNNSSTYWEGGGVYLDGASARVENCTIVANTVASSRGGGVRLAAGSLANSIVWNNTAGGLASDYHGAVSAVTHSCAPELYEGEGNITDAPRFVAAASHDYRQAFDSPTLDAGTNLAAVAWDRNGLARPADSLGSGTARHDMGAFEHGGPETEPALTCAFRATGGARYGLAPLADVTFTAYVAGPTAATTIVHYAWTLGPHSASGSDKRTTAHAFELGGHAVTLTVTNTLDQHATATIPSYVQAFGNAIHVGAGRGNTAPFVSWNHAAANLGDAVFAAHRAILLGAASATVHVTNGTYTIARQLDLNRPIALRGHGGRENVILRSPLVRERFAALTHAGARLEGVTVRDGNAGHGMQVDGVLVSLSAGTVTNCILRNAVGGGSNQKPQGGGIHVGGGLVVDSAILSNRSESFIGGGLNISADLVERCFINGNLGGTTHGYPRAGGGGVYMTGGTLRNSLIVGNETQRRSGAGVQMAGSGALLESCTVVNNTALSAAVGPEYGAGVRVKASLDNTSTYADPPPAVNNQGTVRNCVIWGNKLVSTPDDVLAHADAVSYSLAGNLTNTLGVVWGVGNLVVPPSFVDAGAGDYRLTHHSPGVEDGSTQSWMTTGGVTDLGGNPRVLNRRVDMGAYEVFVPPRGTVLLMR